MISHPLHLPIISDDKVYSLSLHLLPFPLCLHVHTYSRMSVHVHGDQRLMSSIFIFLHHSPIYFLYRALTEPGIQLSWIANSRHLPVSMSPVLWWQMHATKPSIFVWVLKDLNSDSHAWLSQSLHGPVHLVVFSLSQGLWPRGDHVGPMHHVCHKFMHPGSSTSSWGKYALDLLDYTTFSSGGFWFLLGIVTT